MINSIIIEFYLSNKIIFIHL